MNTMTRVAIGDIRDLLTTGVNRAQASQRTIIASHVSPLHDRKPLDAFAAAMKSCRNRWYWISPSDGVELAGIGTAYEIAADGSNRFDAVRRAWEDLIDGAVIGGASVPGGGVSYLSGAGPQIFGGFAFQSASGDRRRAHSWDGFPDARFVLPQVMVGRKGGHTWLTVNRAVNQNSDPDHEEERIARLVRTFLGSDGDFVERSTPSPAQGMTVLDAYPEEWKKSVRAVVEAIKAGQLAKAVIARSIRVEAPAPFDPARILRALEDEYPMCYRFAFQRDERCFVGSTPELLAARNDRVIRSMALAGSQGRGRSPVDDARLGASLLGDAKNLGEHAVVVDAVRVALEPICEALEMPAAPTLLKLPNVQHLYTPATGLLRSDLSIFDITRRLHPTPAVGGRPLQSALRCIAEHESIDRGWYAGPIGVVDRSGDGAFAVAIRSALLRGNLAELFAGCGIVGGSDPDVEYEESRLKMMPILSSLERSATW